MLFSSCNFVFFCRAIQASLELYQMNDASDTTEQAEAAVNLDSDLHMALMLSEQESKKQEEQRLQEEKLLEEILKLSMTEK